MSKPSNQSTKMANVRCECGEWSGVQCPWVGDREETRVVEFMPIQYRDSHSEAGNNGVYPQNGAVRIRVTHACADAMVAGDSSWVIDGGE